MVSQGKHNCRFYLVGETGDHCGKPKEVSRYGNSEDPTPPFNGIHRELCLPLKQEWDGAGLFPLRQQESTVLTPTQLRQQFKLIDCAG